MGWVKKEDVLQALEIQRQLMKELRMINAEHILIHYAIRVIEEMPDKELNDGEE